MCFLRVHVAQNLGVKVDQHACRQKLKNTHNVWTLGLKNIPFPHALLQIEAHFGTHSTRLQHSYGTKVILFLAHVIASSLIKPTHQLPSYSQLLSLLLPPEPTMYIVHQKFFTLASLLSEKQTILEQEPRMSSLLLRQANLSSMLLLF